MENLYEDFRNTEDHYMVEKCGNSGHIRLNKKYVGLKLCIIDPESVEARLQSVKKDLDFRAQQLAEKMVEPYANAIWATIKKELDTYLNQLMVKNSGFVSANNV